MITPKGYGCNFKLCKACVQTPGLLMVGVDIGKSCYTTCFGIQHGVFDKKFEFVNS